MSSDGDASSQQIVASESLFIVFINTDSYAYSLLLFLKKKAMKPNKLARVSFVKKKKKQTKKHDDGTRKANCIRVSFFFARFRVYFLSSYASGLWRLHSSH